MPRLIQIENIKTFSSNTFRVIISLHLLFFILVLLSVSRIELSLGQFAVSRLFQFPYLWEFFPWVASWFNLLLAVLIIVLTCNEFRFNTFRQQVMNGMHEGHLTLGKVYIILLIALYALLLVVVSGLVSGGMSNSSDSSWIDLAGFQDVGMYFLQTIAYMAMAFLFAVLFKTNGLSIVIFILYLFPGEVIIRNLIFPSLENYFPAKLISGLTPFPELFAEQLTTVPGGNFQMGPAATAELGSAESAAIALLYTVVFVAISYVILKRRSL
jgi:hypothetical protein